MRATISECGNYRYVLERDIANEGKLFLFCGVNPSTASHLKDDNTSKRWNGFTKLFGGRGYIAINPFCYRTKEVKDLKKVADPFGPDRLKYLQDCFDRADILVPCWGSTTKVPKNLRHAFGEMLDMMRATGKPVMCFGKTESGDPAHPLFLPYDTKLIPF